MIALEEIGRGEQVNISYGKKCNTRFLLNYGFTNVDNNANEYPFTVKMQDDDKFASEKREILKTKHV